MTDRATLDLTCRAVEARDRLRAALTTLIEDINTYGEPRRHATAIREGELAIAAVDASERTDR